MSKWAEYYKDRVGESYTAYFMERYRPFLDVVYSGLDNHYEEQGCGIGTVTKLLHEQFALPLLNLSAIDRCSDMLNLARQNLGTNYPFIHLDIIANMGDIGQEIRGDLVIHSHGVLEHFSDQEIALVLAKQRYEAHKVVHYVPTNGYPEPSFGDERLLPWHWWVETWKPTNFFTFNNRKDLVLIWED